MDLGRIAGGAIAIALIGLGVSACSGDAVEAESDGVFDREGFSFKFEYPSDFSETDEITTDQQVGGQALAQAGVFFDTEEHDILLVEEYQLALEIDKSNLGVVEAEIDDLLAGVATDAPRAERIEVAGLPALRYADIAIPTVEDGVSTINFIFDGDREYLVNCQSTPSGRDQVAEACDLALETLEPR